MSTQMESAPPNFEGRSPADKLQLARATVQALPEAEKKAFATELSRQFPPPDQTTSNKVWLLIIRAFVSVMGLSVATLCITVFVAPAAGGTAPDKILTVFTTVTAFLAGLFAPSPVGGGKTSG
jgi:hypothetical protein